jgi:hypothetical protein
MPRTRRFALVAALALLGALAMAGCGRSQPGTAAYVGDTRYTERQIDTIAGELRGSPAARDVGSPRTTAVGWLVLSDLARRAAAERSLEIPPADYAGYARQLDLPADAAAVKAVAEWVAVRDLIAERAEPVTPTDADIREAYNALRAEPGAEQLTYEEVADRLRQDPNLPVMVAVRNMLRDAAGRHRLVVNPRYRPLVTEVGWLPLVLAGGSEQVTDRARRT